jgi:hypothetical protein
MLDDAFKKQRAQTVRDLAAKANDSFIKRRLLDLATRYEDTGSSASRTLATLDLQFKSKGTGSEQ